MLNEGCPYPREFIYQQFVNPQFVVLVSSALVILAWIGSTMNNLFLSYLLTLTLVSYPGLCSYGVVDKVKGLVGTHLKGLMAAIYKKED